MRTLFQDYAVDQNGQVVVSATINVYLAGTSTAASIYTAETGGTAVNSVTSDSTTGYFSFYVDDTDYDTFQEFKIQIVKPNYSIFPIDNVRIFDRAQTIHSGAGTPESSVTAPVGSLYLRTDGGAGTTFYVKESGAGNTGWIGK